MALRHTLRSWIGEILLTNRRSNASLSTSMGVSRDTDLSMPACRGVDIEHLSILQLQQYLSERTFSSRDLAECYLERIQRLNGLLKAVIQVNPDALSIAERLDRERERGEVRGPLHGIPFLVKDVITLSLLLSKVFRRLHGYSVAKHNMATKDSMHTTAGSKMLVGAKVSEDAHVVKLLREAGGVLLGHTNLSEWASMRSSYYSEGYSSRGGQCRNPFNLAEHPGGSSCGSAVAVATNMCAFSLGTETDGSIMFPADRNGVVGIKPTVGVTSTRGVIPESSSLDSVGAFGKSVLDVALGLDGITGAVQSGDASSARNHTYASFVTTKEALRDARFGLPWKRVWETAKVQDTKRGKYNALMDVIQRIRQAGAEVIQWTDFPSAEQIIPPTSWDWDYPSKEGHPEQSEFTVIKTDFYNDIQTYLSSLTTNPNNISSLEDIVSWNARHAEAEGGEPCVHPAWPTGQDTFEQSLASKGVMDDTYHHALQYIRRKSREEGIDAALSMPDGSHLDGLLVPIQADSGLSSQVAAKAGM
ncbi:hypothetical protein FQN50_004506 [Emmonsiellopsis sp. PD_5]|nr:hypothetical protein FQN50_004506 [Emmonsiellopsis sp. PD_5]